jgi:hypothetical protein
MAIFGIVLNRFSVCILAFDRPANMSYFPSWPELGVSIGIVAAASLVFLFFAENLKIYGHEDAPESAASSADGSRFNPASVASMMPESIAAPRRYSLAVIVAAGLTVGFLPREAMFGLQPPETPVAPVRAITGAVQSGNGDGNGPYVLASLSTTAAPNENLTSLMLIDGNRDGQFVLFAHSGHVKALGEEKSCGACHHMNMPFDQNSSCSECHRDMYEPTDIFDHSSHLAHLNGNQGCVKCHADSSQPKSRATSTACGECHADMAVEGSFVPNKGPFMDEPAASYMNAMHGLCVKCHEEKVEQDPGQFQPAFAQCASCHETALMFDLREQGPYAQMPDGNGGGEKALADSISGHSAR